MKVNNQAYLICQSTTGQPIAAITENKIPEGMEHRSKMVLRQGGNLTECLKELDKTAAENHGRLNLSAPSNFPNNPNPSPLQVVYNIAENYIYDVLNALLRILSSNTITGLLDLCHLRSRCVIRVYKYCIYAENEIPLDEVRNYTQFIQKVEESEFRKRYGIFCIAEKYEMANYEVNMGIVYYDASLL